METPDSSNMSKPKSSDGKDQTTTNENEDNNLPLTLTQYSLSNEERNTNFVIILIVPDGQTQFNCSRSLSSAASHIRRSKLAYKWLELDKTDVPIPMAGNIFVLDAFQGTVYDHLKEELAKFKNFMVIGPFCLQSILLGTDWNVSSINRGIPVFTLGMRALVISLSGFKYSTLKAKLTGRILKMGGVLAPKLNIDVTHLVAQNVLTEKCGWAYSHGIQVMTEEWIHEVWKESSSSIIHALHPTFSIFKCPLFHNLKFCISNVNEEEKLELRRFIIKKGGEYFPTLENETDVLIIPKAEGPKFQDAMDWKIPCVNPKWIDACKVARHVVSMDGFRVKIARARTSISSKTRLPRNSHSREILRVRQEAIENIPNLDVELELPLALTSQQISGPEPETSPAGLNENTEGVGRKKGKLRKAKTTSKASPEELLQSKANEIPTTTSINKKPSVAAPGPNENAEGVGRKKGKITKAKTTSKASPEELLQSQANEIPTTSINKKSRVAAPGPNENVEGVRRKKQKITKAKTTSKAFPEELLQSQANEIPTMSINKKSSVAPSTSKGTKAATSPLKISETQSETLKKKTTGSEQPGCDKKRKTPFKFMLTGFDTEEERYESLVVGSGIVTLGGIVHVGEEFSPDAYALLAQNLVPDGTTLAAIASGKLILHSNYIQDCIQAEKFLPPEDYLWTREDKRNETEATISESYSYWYARIKANSADKPFTKFRAFLAIADPSVETSFKNMILAGGGKVIDAIEIESANVVLCDSVPQLRKSLGKGVVVPAEVQIKHTRCLVDIIFNKSPPNDEFFVRKPSGRI